MEKKLESIGRKNTEETTQMSSGQFGKEFRTELREKSKAKYQEKSLI